MNFKQFLTLDETAALFDETKILEENWLTSGLKFTGGTAGNLLGQTVRGAGNILGGTAKALAGSGQAALSGLQGLGGGSAQAKTNIKKAGKNIVGGVGQALKGGLQVGASPVTALLRGAQASGEDLAPKPLGKDRSWYQKTLGLNTWNQQKNSTQQEPADAQQEVPDTQKTPAINAKEQEWERLGKAYLQTQDKNEKKAYLQQLQQLDPKRYDLVIRRAQQKQARAKLKSLGFDYDTLAANWLS